MNSGCWRSACLLLACLLVPVAASAGESVPAQLDWLRHISLSTPESGFVEQVSVAPGDAVQQGQELLRLDTRAQQAQLAAAEAALAEVELQLAEAERERERTQELYDRTLLADHDLQLAQIAYARARTQHAEARAHRVQAQQQLEYRILHAPWAGRVITVSAQPGQALVNRLEAVPLIELAGEGEMLARSRVEAGRLAALRIGMGLEVEASGKRYAGIVHSLGGQVEAGEPREGLTVRFTVPADVHLWPGMPARIQLP